jgi:ABC-2 type transport system ATP-binding protein
MIELDHVTKQFGAVTAVNDICLRIAPGELFGCIGPNGAGKTTTIRMIGGLLAPTAGRVRINGVDMAQDPVIAKQQIGFIPDRPYLYDKLTAQEFLRFTADLYGVSADQFAPAADAWLDRFGLADRRHQLIESFSHGMKQRLIMAAALLHHPRVLVVDEPMVGLDPSGIRMVRGLFRELVDQGTTIFLSTHTLSLAESVCDRIGIISDGRLVAIGSLSEIRDSARLADDDLESVFLQLTRTPEPP